MTLSIDPTEPEALVPRHPATRQTRLLGRSEELADLSSLLERARLITLTGPPGIGKSRLAYELARQLAGGYEGGTALVELASLSDGVHVPAAVASALSVAEAPGERVTDTLAAALAPRRMLLVVDNCEHVLEDCAELLDGLLAGCPKLVVVATSREPLAFPRESVWQVPPLSVPGQSEEDFEGELIDFAAVRLFVERAAAVEPGFSLNDYIAPSVVEICRRLDGIPLAIELAAARVGLLTPPEIAQRLDDRFDLLTDAGAGGLARHQTLEAALDWSYELLSGAERALLGRLSVFAGGFDVEAATLVCAGQEIEAASVSEIVGRLAAKSLVASHAAGGYRLLETVRAYGAQRLEEAGETPKLREAHARFYLGLAEEAEAELTGPEQERWFERLEAERADLRSALEWSIGHGRTEWSLRLAGALVLFWRVRCHFSEGRGLLDAALSAGGPEVIELRAKALWGAGFMAHWAGDNDAALAPTEQSLSRFRELGDLSGCARALLTLGGCTMYRHPAAALTLFQESAALARKGHDAWCLVQALGASGFEYLRRDEIGAARPLFEECLEVARQAQDKQSLRWGLVGLGQAAFHQGDYRSAEPLLEEAVALARKLGDDYTEGWALQYLGLAAAGVGEYDRARELLDGAMAAMRGGRPGALILPLVARARLARAEGHLARARDLLEEAVTVARTEANDPAPVLTEMAELSADEGDTRTARRLLEEVLDLARSTGARRMIARALHGLGELARAEGERDRATLLHREALELWCESGNAPGIATSLEALAGLCATDDRYEPAARIFGAAEALRDANRYTRAAWHAPSHEAVSALLRRALSADQFEAAVRAGAVAPLEQAVDAALGRDRGSEGRSSDTWSTLTERERGVAALVGEGLTNRQIAERLFISPGTVKYHVSNIFVKLGIARRSELARELARRELLGAKP